MKNIFNYKSFLNGKYTSLNENTENTEIFEYNDMIDYTLLDNNVDDNAIIELCRKAKQFSTKSVCVMPKHVKIANEQLKDSSVLVCTVISFPGGTNSLEQKESETNQVISDGADEVDMVLNYQSLKTEWIDNPTDENSIPIYNQLVEEVKSLVNICHNSTNKDGDRIILKVIVESGLLTIEQTRTTTDICLDAGADYIKTSTGMVSVGAELDKIKVMSETIKGADSNMKIKASGGVRTLGDIKAYLPYVDRLGMGFGSVDKLNGLDSNSEGY